MKTKAKNGKLRLCASLLIFLMALIPMFGNADTNPYVTANFTSTGGTQPFVIPFNHCGGNGCSNSWVSVSSQLWFDGELHFTVTASPNPGYSRMDCFLVAQSVTVIVYQTGSTVSLGVLKPNSSTGIRVKVAKWQSPVPSLS